MADDLVVAEVPPVPGVAVVPAVDKAENDPVKASGDGGVILTEVNKVPDGYQCPDNVCINNNNNNENIEP